MFSDFRQNKKREKSTYHSEILAAIYPYTAFLVTLSIFHLTIYIYIYIYQKSKISDIANNTVYLVYLINFYRGFTVLATDFQEDIFNYLSTT